MEFHLQLKRILPPIRSETWHGNGRISVFAAGFADLSLYDRECSLF